MRTVVIGTLELRGDSTLGRYSAKTSVLRVVGTENILMSDYRIEPPTFMFGALKAADLVVVKFDVELRAVFGSRD